MVSQFVGHGPGVVHQDAHPSETVGGGGRRSVHLTVVGYVAGRSLGGTTRRIDRLGHDLEAIRPASRDRG